MPGRKEKSKFDQRFITQETFNNFHYDFLLLSFKFSHGLILYQFK